jgi:hypothetical protein
LPVSHSQPDPNSQVSSGAPENAIRPVDEADIPAVADLFQRIFVAKGHSAPAALVDYMNALFIDGPERDPAIRSKVHVKPDGRISGFIGAMPLAMSFKGTALRAAVCGPLMVDGHAADPLAGARLLRAFLAGPQDLSLTETANAVSTAMWRKLRGTALPDYSLEWVYVLRPAGFALETRAWHSAARFLRPVAGTFDILGARVLERMKRSGPLQVAKTGLSCEADDAAVVDLIKRFTSAFELHPVWHGQALEYILADAASKSQFGPLRRCVVTTRSGNAIGAYLYHGGKGRIARVLQILHAPGQAGAVIEQLLGDAGASGAVGLRLRVQPWLLDALLGRGGFFLHRSSTLVHSRNPALLAPFVSGKAFFNGLAGEAWSRLNGDQFV